MKLKNIIFGCVALSLGFTSCDMDYHEYKVDGEDYIKENFENVNGLMTTIYRDLDSDWGNYSGAMLASATDEAVYSHQATLSRASSTATGDLPMPIPLYGTSAGTVSLTATSSLTSSPI